MSAYDAQHQFEDNLAVELQRLSAATARIESELQQIERKIGR